MSGIFDGPATGVTGGNFVVTTAGTQLQLTATPTPCVWVKITAAPANTGGIVVGDADVDGSADAESGITVAKGTTETSTSETDPCSGWTPPTRGTSSAT